MIAFLRTITPHHRIFRHKPISLKLGRDKLDIVPFYCHIMGGSSVQVEGLWAFRDPRKYPKKFHHNP
jgi:hypothetical protein